MLTKPALMLRLEAKPGKAGAVARFLRKGADLVRQEPDTAAWFALRLGPSTFAIFDTFVDEAGRQSHLTGEFAASLRAVAGALLAQLPVIERADVLAARLMNPRERPPAVLSPRRTQPHPRDPDAACLRQYL